MSSSESLDEHALGGDGPSLVVGASMGSGHSLHRSLATYRYENALIKTELAATLERHGREMEELRLKYESKVREVERQRQDLEERLLHVQDSEADRGSRLHQTNLHLQHKIKGLEEDLAANTQARERLQREKSQAEQELEEAKFSRQTSEQKLMAENEKLSREGEELRKEVEKERVALREVTATLSSERHQHQLIKSRVNEVEQHCQVQLTLAEAQAAQLRKEKAEEEAAAARRLDEVMGLLDEERAVVARVREGAAARQKEAERRMAEERQTQLSGMQQLSRHNAELQEEVKKLEDKLRKMEERQEGRGRELREELRVTTEKLQAAEKEAAIAGARVASLEELEKVLRQERASASTLRQELHRSQAEVQELSDKNGELRKTLKRLNDELCEVRAQHEAAREEVQREQTDRVRVVADLRTAHQEEAERLRARISTLENYLADKSAKYLEDSSQLRQKLRTYSKLIKKLRHKLELGALQVEQLEAQRAALQDNVPANRHAHLQAQFQALTRKHNEFSAFLRGLSEFHSSLPEIAELTTCVGALNQKLNEMEEDQRHCFSDLDSL
ncbi:trichohyalin-like [Eriocheir sinensis]|uniref:trichohyalin-like n=1 Tax=Eriocheir sinensis TaxID=95602 RepID=UPI0021C7FFAB|nr:trichohyalin-like [Eriocheir sinensis]XP_050729646.1 trichohyalin-like [Eriocheir sinensis]XP_050729647.1 trichohyalin-like [Eriocheir sinensis]